MQIITKPLIKYFGVLIIFSMAINIIYLALPLYMMIVYDRVLFSFSLATLTTMIVGVLLSLCAIGLIDYCRSQVLGYVGNALAERLIPLMLRGMLQDATALNSQGYTRGLLDINCVREALVQGRILPYFDLPWVVIYLVILFFIHPLIGGVTTGMLFLITTSQFLLQTFESRRSTTADVVCCNQTESVRENILCHAELVSAMGLLPAVVNRYQAGYKTILPLRSETDTFHSGVGAVLRFLHFTTVAAVFGAGVYVFFSGEITTGIIFAVVMITARLLVPFELSFQNLKHTIEAAAAFKRLRYFLAMPAKNKLSLPPPEGRLTAEAVSLVIHGKALVQNVTFALEPGETLGILGPSSAGKTTLCKVLLGIWPTSTGKVRLDGADICQWSEDELCKYIGYMPQEPELFPGTVADNIARLMKVDPDKVVHAAQKAGVHELILQFAQGYDTKIDQYGKNLSAGQRQLISLARALYDDPKLVILDEPHTYLDDTGLRILQQVLTELKKENITTIVVTDRTNLILTLDKLLMIRNGHIALYGPRQTVLDQLANKQQSQQAAGV